MAGAVYDPAVAGDAPAIAVRLAELAPAIHLFHSSAMLSAVLLLVFAAGLHRQLVQRVGADSLLPRIASHGLSWCPWRS